MQELGLLCSLGRTSGLQPCQHITRILLLSRNVCGVFSNWDRSRITVCSRFLARRCLLDTQLNLEPDQQMGAELLWVSISSSFDYMPHELQLFGLAPVHGARTVQEQAPGVTCNPVEGLDCNWCIHGRKYISQQLESCTHHSLP